MTEEALLASEPQPGRPAEIELDIWALGEVLWRRRAVILILLGLFSVLGVALALRRPTIYQATALLQVAPSADLVPVVAPLTPEATTNVRRPIVDTRADLIKSPAVLGPALARLSAEDRAAFPPQLWELPVNVKGAPNSDLVSVEVLCTRPEAAVNLANAITQVYVENVKAANQKLAATITQSLEPELKAAKDRLAQAQEKLTRLRERTGVYAFSSTYARVFSDLAEVRRSSPEAPVRTGLADVEAEIAAQEAALKEAERLRRAGGESAEVRERVKSLRIALAESRARLAHLREEEKRLERRLDELNRISAQMRALEAEVTARENILQAVQDKMQQMLVNSTAQLATVQIAAPATSPPKPAGSPKRLVVLAGALVGLLLGVTLALVQEGVAIRRRGLKLRA